MCICLTQEGECDKCISEVFQFLQYSQHDIYIPCVRVQTIKKDYVPCILHTKSTLVVRDLSHFTVAHAHFLFRKKIHAQEKNLYWLKHEDNPFYACL